MAKLNDGKKHFKVEPLDIDAFITANDIESITNPVFFDKYSVPTSDGLLSNQIFGITKDERANTFGSIPLGKGEVFLHPLFYRIWGKMDSRIKNIVHGTKTYKINKDGDFEEDINGECGIKFIQKNFNKIKFKRTQSSKRDAIIEFLTKFKNRMFISDMVVIPAYYRDVTTTGKYVGVGDINQIYSKIIMASKSLSESFDYGMNLSDSIRGKIQELLADLYDYFTKGKFQGEPVTGIAGKFGILRKANLSKTTDYSARIVISTPNMKVETMDDMMVDLDYTAVPMASLTANYFPYLMFHMRRILENIFSGNEIFPVISYKKMGDTSGAKVSLMDLSDYMSQFTDEVLKEQLDRFSHGIANRFSPITFRDKSGKVMNLEFVGYECTVDEYTHRENKDDFSDLKTLTRALTWCDLIFIAANEVVKDKCVLITRYPLDTYFNQFATKVVVSSTIKTVSMIVNRQHYKYYPYIEAKDLGKDTTNKFVDTLTPCNLYLKEIDGDFDGDQVSCKSLYSMEANDELLKNLNSKAHYIALNGKCMLETDIEGAQSIYNLTLVLNDDKSKLVDPMF